MFIAEAKVLIAREMGWTLEYIGQLDRHTAVNLVAIIRHQRAAEHYALARLFAMQSATYANSVSKRRFHIHDFVGHEPKELKGVTALTQKKTQPITIALADGNRYELDPMNLNVMEEVENHYDKMWTELFSTKGVRMGHIKYALWCILKRKYPDMTLEAAGDLLTSTVVAANQEAIIKHLTG